MLDQEEFATSLISTTATASGERFVCLKNVEQVWPYTIAQLVVLVETRVVNILLITV